MNVLLFFVDDFPLSFFAQKYRDRQAGCSLCSRNSLLMTLGAISITFSPPTHPHPPSLLIRNKYVTLLFVTTNHLICAFLRRVIIQMKRLGLNQTQLAKRMKVSRPYVTKLLSGDVNITFGTAMRLAQALQMDFFPDLREKTEPEVAAAPSAT